MTLLSKNVYIDKFSKKNNTKLRNNTKFKKKIILSWKKNNAKLKKKNTKIRK